MTSKQVMRTKRALNQALYDLLQTNYLEKITVKMIVDQALTDRSTFYRYYQDKFDLLRDVIFNFLHGTTYLNDNILEDDPMFIRVVGWLDAHASLFRHILVNNSDVTFYESIVTNIAAEGQKFIETMPPNELHAQPFFQFIRDAPKPEIIITSLSSMILSTILQWLQDDALTMADVLAAIHYPGFYLHQLNAKTD
ncbi:hypothetical protein FC83_GL001552 [Agrilactobacillus composti DSM 18527 = JCM 14202]|uniref:HTH tetR-type domain-containing protein n=1 Tax=Agrilactobacillus composti DSM 18527 = JCM 14202 TaxID=1423734 RepID=X0PD66_9LACO|nr:TetR/AcrR family transcriptional regulator [Agrilactobacillus composti]KRM30421.1 hypothetical protein FC83_GL001552 [Agrilactobacillus composti DSM 18527 = JCM 14202]GAF38894.1 TetR family regulatory protein [Agrilactobacillus composti DSM 18527 = JCM 14202]